ncbi:C-type lectin domain family 10 member A-like isoform X2 [Ptychodera flava]|uniref:C-type lectin domain family 10 member A-like isoform X2 n=1 Tax=Ptychodera flava TaxID=63121 RepID=UPI00396A6893
MALLKTIAFLFCMNQLTQAAVTQLGQRECPSNDDYCYRSDVCAYVFTFPANDDETCPGRQDTVTAMSAVRDELNKQESSIHKIADISDGLVDSLSKAKTHLKRHDESLVKSQRYIASVSDTLDQFKDEGRAKSEALEAELTRLKLENEEQQQILANQTRKLVEQREEINSIRDSITITMPDAVCEENWHYYNNHCYNIEQDIKTFRAAEANCQGKDSHLAKVTDIEESHFLTGILGDTDWAWIGLEYKGLSQTGRWEWIDGTQATFFDWVPGEPNNFQGTRENCVHIRMEKDGQWNDWACWGEIKSICEKEAAAIEDPVEARLSRLERNSAYNNNRLAALADDVAHLKQLITEQGELLQQQSQQLDNQQ